MASEELKRKVKKYQQILTLDGYTENVMQYLVNAIKVAYKTEKDPIYGEKISSWAKNFIEETVRNSPSNDIWLLDDYSYKTKRSFNILNQYYDILKSESYTNFESYMLYLEKKRDQKKRFYLPRMEVLGCVARDLEDLEKDIIDFYGLSMPPRVGKSTICIFFLSWVMMRKPNTHNAMGGHSGILAKGFFKEVMNILTSEDYTFEELYLYWHPNHTMIRDKSAEDYTITLDEADRFASLTCRGCDATWTGAIDISGSANISALEDLYVRLENGDITFEQFMEIAKHGYLYVDDLVRDREHSLSAQRMENTYQLYLNTMVDRKNNGSKELMVGTLWSVLDPLFRIEAKYKGNPRYRFRKIPALNERDESNFNYKLGIGFTTQFYRDMRDRLDNAEWMAKYQQSPYVREGLLFGENAIHYFDGTLDLLGGNDITTIMVVDPSLGGDYVSAPVCKYSDVCTKKLIIDWVYDNSTTKITVPKVVDKIIKHGVTEVVCEVDGVGSVYEMELKNELKKRGVTTCKVTPVHAPNRIKKEEKIKGCSDYIKDNFYFLNPELTTSESIYLRENEYFNAMTSVNMYTTLGKNLNDDAPDSLAQMSMIFKPLSQNGHIEIPTWFSDFMRGVYND